jgi:hypothetical protein
MIAEGKNLLKELFLDETRVLLEEPSNDSGTGSGSKEINSSGSSQKVPRDRAVSDV